VEPGSSGRTYWKDVEDSDGLAQQGLIWLNAAGPIVSYRAHDRAAAVVRRFGECRVSGGEAQITGSHQRPAFTKGTLP
jgi:hypothetical protein